MSTEGSRAMQGEDIERLGRSPGRTHGDEVVRAARELAAVLARRP